MRERNGGGKGQGSANAGRAHLRRSLRRKRSPQLIGVQALLSGHQQH